MNTSLSKILAALAGIFLIAYVCYQTFIMLYSPYITETVYLNNYVQDIDLNGFFIRDEELIEVSKSGVVSYNYKNAKKISNGAIIANLYNSEEDLLNLEQVELLEIEREILINAQNTEANEGLKLDLLNSQVFSAKLELVKQVDLNDFSSLEPAFTDLMSLMTKIEVFVDESVDYTETILDLDRRIENLKMKIPTQTTSIVSDKSGYFSNTVDGYEEILTPEFLKNLTIDSALEVLNNPLLIDKDNIGKMVNENIWNFVAVITSKEAELLKSAYDTGKTVTLQFNSTTIREIDTKIINMITEKENDYAVVVFDSAIVDENLINMRFEMPKLIINTYNGIVLPKTALRIRSTDDEQRVKGVYVMYNESVDFKLVDVIYEDDYVIVSNNSINTSYVTNYDQVIIKGRGLNN